MVDRYDDIELQLFWDGQELMLDLNARPIGINLPMPIKVKVPDAFLPAMMQALGASDEELTALGMKLYQAYFAGEVEARFLNYLGGRAGNVGVRVCIQSNYPSANAAAWEILCRDVEAVPPFLALSPRTPVVRVPRITGFAAWNVRELVYPLRVLVILAAPRYAGLDLAAEKRTVEDALGPLEAQYRVEVDYLGFDDPTEASFQGLQARLAQGPRPYDVVHLICHGLLEPGQPGVMGLVHPDSGRCQDVRVADLAALFCERGVMLVVLQSCQSGAVDASKPRLSGAAQYLVEGGMPAVLAMQETIDQDVARYFVRLFYERWLWSGSRLEDALTQVRQCVRQEFRDRAVVWAVPVMYMAPGAQLVVGRAEARSSMGEGRRELEAALPARTRQGKRTEVVVLIRKPEATPLREIIGRQPDDFEARPGDVRPAQPFNVVFPLDQQAGRLANKTLRLEIDTDDFDVPEAKREINLFREADSMLCTVVLTPRREGRARLTVRILDKGDGGLLTLAEVRLSTQVQTGEAFESGYQMAAAGADSLDLSKSLAILANSLRDRYEHSGALSDLDAAIEALEQSVAVADTDSPDRPECLAALASSLRTRYDRSGALPDLDTAIEALEQAVAATGVDPDDRPVYLSSLGNAYADRGDMWNAIGCHEQALALHREIGERQAEGIELANLANAYAAVGETHRAIAYYGRAVPIFRETGDRRSEGYALASLGDALQHLGELGEAQTVYERALPILNDVLGPYHPNVATLMSMLGTVLRDLGDLAGARAAFEQALHIDEQAFGPECPEVAMDINNLGSVLGALANPTGARAAFERARAIFERIWPADHPYVRIVRENLEVIDGGGFQSSSSYLQTLKARSWCGDMISSGQFGESPYSPTSSSGYMSQSGPYMAGPTGVH